MDDTRPFPLTLNEDGSTELVTCRVKPTLTRFQTNSLFTPMDSTPATFFVKCMCVSVAYDNVFGVGTT